MKSTDAVEVVYPLWVDCLEGGIDINDVIKLSWNWYNETITEKDINHD